MRELWYSHAILYESIGGYRRYLLPRRFPWPGIAQTFPSIGLRNDEPRIHEQVTLCLAPSSEKEHFVLLSPSPRIATLHCSLAPFLLRRAVRTVRLRCMRPARENCSALYASHKKKTKKKKKKKVKRERRKREQGKEKISSAENTRRNPFGRKLIQNIRRSWRINQKESLEHFILKFFEVTSAKMLVACKVCY